MTYVDNTDCNDSDELVSPTGTTVMLLIMTAMDLLMKVRVQMLQKTRLPFMPTMMVMDTESMGSRLYSVMHRQVSLGNADDCDDFSATINPNFDLQRTG